MELSPATFVSLRDLIYERSGIFFQENKKYLLEGRLQAGARETVPHVRAGAGQAGRPHAAAFLPLVGEVAHVREHAARRDRKGVL